MVADSFFLVFPVKLIFYCGGLCSTLSSWSLFGSLMAFYCYLKKKLRLQSFVDEGEREMMHEQIIALQDKVCIVESSRSWVG